MMLDCTFRLLCYCILAFHRNYWFRNELVEFEKEGFTPRVRNLFKDIVSTEEIAYKNISNSKCWLGNAFDKAYGRERVTALACMFYPVLLNCLSVFSEDWLSLHENFQHLKAFCLIFSRFEVCLSFVWLFKLYLPNRRSMLGFCYVNQWKGTGWSSPVSLSQN